MRREKPRQLFTESAAPAMNTHCVRCEARLAQLEGRWSHELAGWLCDTCTGTSRDPE